MQRWSDPADAWPICAGGSEKATPFDQALNRRANTALYENMASAFMLQISAEAPFPDIRTQIKNIKFNNLNG
jgi:hypothetical protein